MSGWVRLNSSIIVCSSSAGPCVWPCQNSISTGSPLLADESHRRSSSPPPQAASSTTAASATSAASILVSFDTFLSSCA